MPILILMLIATVAGSLVFVIGNRLPTAAVAEEASQAAGRKLGHEAVRHPWLSRTLRSRLDPATATGLALTVALLAAVAGGLVLGLLAYLMRTNAQMGILANVLIGIVGSFIGHAVANQLHLGANGTLASWIVSVLGAALLIAILSALGIFRRTARI